MVPAVASSNLVAHPSKSPGIIDNTVSVINGATNLVTATLPVGSGRLGVGIDPTADTAYVANSNSTTVSVIAGF